MEIWFKSIRFFLHVFWGIAFYPLQQFELNFKANVAGKPLSINEHEGIKNSFRKIRTCVMERI